MKPTDVDKYVEKPVNKIVENYLRKIRNIDRKAYI